MKLIFFTHFVSKQILSVTGYKKQPVLIKFFDKKSTTNIIGNTILKFLKILNIIFFSIIKIIGNNVKTIKVNLEKIIIEQKITTVKMIF